MGRFIRIAVVAVGLMAMGAGSVAEAAGNAATQPASGGSWMYMVHGNGGRTTYTTWFYYNPKYPSYVYSYSSKTWIRGTFRAIGAGKWDFTDARFSTITYPLILSR
jgi:hypothetical protein